MFFFLFVSFSTMNPNLKKLEVTEKKDFRFGFSVEKDTIIKTNFIICN